MSVVAVVVSLDVDLVARVDRRPLEWRPFAREVPAGPC